MRPARRSAAWGVVAQLVHRRTAVWPSSTLAQGEYKNSRPTSSRASLGKMGNCWLVSDGAKKGNPASRQAASIS